jgi:DNA-binding transcriptional LysR family regulator
LVSPSHRQYSKRRHQVETDMLTLRQIEVVRAIMVTGTIGGAAKLLGVSAPGVSRVMKHTESTFGLRLFVRHQGRYAPTPEAKDIFAQINAVYTKVEDLHFVIKGLEMGAGQSLRLGSVPSIANVMVPRAIARVRKAFPSLRMTIDIIKIEELIDYLLLGKGEIVATSYRLDHPMLGSEPLATGRLFCIVPDGHALASRTSVSADEIASYPLVGIDPNDPYGRIMAGLFDRAGASYDVPIRARFGTTVCGLVKAGLGIAVIDQFTIADGGPVGVTVIPIKEPTEFQTFVTYRSDGLLSSYSEAFITLLRDEMERTVAASRAKTPPRPVLAKK